jgi:hypothetical protein
MVDLLGEREEKAKESSIKAASNRALTNGD